MRRLQAVVARYVRSPPADRRAMIHRYCRKIFFRLARFFTPTLEAVWPAGHFVVATSDAVISRITFVDGPFALDVGVAAHEFVCDILGESFDLADGDVLEVGANIGTGSVAFVTVLGARRVHAFEPAPENFRLLRQTVLANDLSERILTHQVALSNSDGHVLFELAPRTWGDHRVRVAKQHGADAFDEADRDVVTVPSATIDSLVRNGTLDLTKIKLVWVDIQGHEGFFMEGALELLRTSIPVVVEFWPYGLSRVGGVGKFVELAQEHYTHFLNVNNARHSLDDGRSTRDRLEPVSALSVLSAQYRRSPDHADLILFSLDDIDAA